MLSFFPHGNESISKSKSHKNIYHSVFLPVKILIKFKLLTKPPVMIGRSMQNFKAFYNTYLSPCRNKFAFLIYCLFSWHF